MCFSFSLILLLPAAQPAPNPVVEAEEIVFRYAPADNGSGPLWCFGSNYFTATPRGGSAPSTTLDLFGSRFQPPSGDAAMCYARVKWNSR